MSSTFSYDYYKIESNSYTYSSKVVFNNENNLTKQSGIVAHVDAGKTTFSEQLLYHTKVLNSEEELTTKTPFLHTIRLKKNEELRYLPIKELFHITVLLTI